MSVSAEQRRLAAIMFTDMVGYSALSQRNEALALELLEEHRRILRSIFPRFNGTEIKTIGDAFLVEFQSALEAAQCALEIQRTLAKRNHDVSREHRIELRIGIHVGDVVHREGDVYGDGVNIASRIEPLAGPGGICVSMDVERQIRNALEARFEKLAPTELKNISVPMDLFRIVLPWEQKAQVAAKSKTASPSKPKTRALAAGIVGIILLLAIGWWWTRQQAAGPASPASASHITSIAVLPFENTTGNADTEYLSDGMTETLISGLSQLPNLNVKARASVFRYKGKGTGAAQIAKELKVQSILSGRVGQRGNDLLLYIELVDVALDRVIWSQQYNRKQADLVMLQSQIAHDVSNRLQTKLSEADETKITKVHTTNTEAYQLYLKGRYHFDKNTPSELQTGISYFRHAIEVDPSYALAYVGIGEAYRQLAIAGEMPSTEAFPKAKTAAQKALDIDDTLAEAHAAFGSSTFWYDWNWDEAENHYKQALDLNPNSADVHWAYAHLLSNTARHAEALVEIRRARELDPLSLFVNALEAQFLIHAGQADEALVRLQKTFEIEPNYWLAHLFASSAYIEKGMYPEALAEANKVKELFGVIGNIFGGYALAKSGKKAEARVLLAELLKLSATRDVSAYQIGLIYNGLGERDETLAWLERAYKQRDPKLTFLKVEPKWNNLRDDPHFQDILRRMNFPE